MGSLSRGTKADQFSYVPAGTVLPFAGDTAPSGWAICNGDPVSRTEYVELFTAIGELWGVGDGSTTFNLPDMRGQFLRGKNNGRADGNEDSEGERDIGSLQLDKTRRPRDTDLTSNSQGSHRHSLYSSNFNADHIVGGVGGSNSHAVAAINTNIGGQGYYLDMGADGADVTNTTGNHAHTITGGGDPETQPKNVAINYIIKL